jgi:uncharacterized membrane protein AbrB (regulator of aidB expression)
MELLGRLVVLVHLLGFATLFGGLVVQLRAAAPEVNAAMLHGAWLELLSGAALVVLLVLDHGQVPYPQLSVKLALTLLVVLLVGKNRKFESIPRGLWALIGGLTLISAGVAVLWQ